MAGRLKVLFLRGQRHAEIEIPRDLQSPRATTSSARSSSRPGDVFGLHRRLHRVLTQPAFVLVFPKVLPLARYDFASQRPIGEIRLANRLYEDPTRTAGVRPYQLGRPAAGASIGERRPAPANSTAASTSRRRSPGPRCCSTSTAPAIPAAASRSCSELGVTLAASLAYAVAAMNQQVGFVSNGRDATERIREEALLPLSPRGRGAGWVRGRTPRGTRLNSRPAAGARENLRREAGQPIASSR